MWITHAWIQTYLKTESYECQCHIIDVCILECITKNFLKKGIYLITHNSEFTLIMNCKVEKSWF